MRTMDSFTGLDVIEPRTAFSYIRFSDPKQRKGFSKERQKDKELQLCKKHGWVLDTSLNIADYGRSGFKDEQVGLKVFLQAIKDGKVERGSVLIVERLDRLSRKKIHKALRLFFDIIEAGVAIATFDPETIHTEESIANPANLMFVLMQFALANESSEEKRYRAKDNFSRKRKALSDGKILTRRCPAWVRLDESSGKFVPIEEKAKLVWQIIRWSADGYGARVITKKFNSNGVVNIAFGTSSRSTKRWTQRYIEEILHDRRILGEYHPCEDGKKWGEQPIKGYFPRVVSDELYYEHLAAMKLRIKSPGQRGEGVSSLFSSIMFDARTQTTMRLNNSSASEKKAGCKRRLTSYASDLGAAEYMSWKYEHFEEVFLRRLRKEFCADQFIPSSQPDRMPALKGALATIEGNIAAVQEKLVSRSDCGPLLDALVNLDSERKAKLAEIEDEKIRQAANRPTGQAELFSVLDMLANAKPDSVEKLRTRLKSLIRQMVKEIWVLIEVGKNRSHRTCRVQVLMATGRIYYYMLLNEGQKRRDVGPSSGEMGHPCSLTDFRKWKDNKEEHERRAVLSASE